MSDLFTTAAIGALAIALAIAAPLVRWAVASAIRDQRREAEAEQVTARAKLKEFLESEARSARKRAEKTLDDALEARKALPVWRSRESPSEDVLSYARKCLKHLDSPFMGSWEFLAAEVTPGCLDHIGSYGFFVEETEWELRIARDRHEVAKAYVKLANVSGGDDARYARNQKKAAKKVVVYLLAVLAERKWQRDHYVRYAYEMREGSRSIMDPKAREIRADEIARERVGPRPVVPDEPSEYSNLELRWQHTSLDPDHTWRG